MQSGQRKERRSGCHGIKGTWNNTSHHIRQCEPVLY